MNMSKLITFAAVAACAAFAAMADKKQFSALDGEAAKRVKTHNLDGSPVVCESVATVEGREASLLPKGRQFKLVWNDEFEGDRLDDSKWGWRTNFWGRAAAHRVLRQAQGAFLELALLERHLRLQAHEVGEEADRRGHLPGRRRLRVH